MVYGLIFIFILIIFFEIPGLIRRKLWRELAAFSVFLTIGFVLSFLQVIGVKIPSPNDGITFLVETVSKMLK
ncbi:MAG TPA: hypothetical protein GXZ27_11655 [Thermoanaerobacterales bacterium]|nr:hypothetical protein [Thermoanaerobacterales bacterium]